LAFHSWVVVDVPCHHTVRLQWFVVITLSLTSLPQGITGVRLYYQFLKNDEICEELMVKDSPFDIPCIILSLCMPVYIFMSQIDICLFKCQTGMVDLGTVFFP